MWIWFEKIEAMNRLQRRKGKRGRGRAGTWEGTLHCFDYCGSITFMLFPLEFFYIYNHGQKSCDKFALLALLRSCQTWIQLLLDMSLLCLRMVLLLTNCEVPEWWRFCFCEGWQPDNFSGQKEETNKIDQNLPIITHRCDPFSSMTKTWSIVSRKVSTLGKKTRLIDGCGGKHNYMYQLRFTCKMLDFAWSKKKYSCN